MLHAQPMPDYFAEAALLPEGWATDARIRVSEDGVIDNVSVGGSSDGAEHLRGPVMPGMVNVHSHAFQRAMAGLTEHASAGDDTFWSWREVMYRFAAGIAPEDLHSIAAQLFVELLRHGYTSVGEFHYLHNQPDGSTYDTRAELSIQVAEAARRAGIAMTLLPVLYVFGGFGELPLAGVQTRFRADPDHALRIVTDLKSRYRYDTRIVIGLAPHSLRAVSPPLLADAIAGLRELDAGAPLHIHIAEQTKEVDDCLAWSGKRPIQWLTSNVELDEGWCLVHGTHASVSELTSIAASGAVVGLCPTTEANLGDGLFDLKTFEAANGRFGIGSDSNVSVSPIEELRWLEYGQRLITRQRNVSGRASRTSTGTSLWQTAAADGARALGQPTGAIKAGRRADLLVLDRNSSNLAGLAGDRIADGLIFSGNDSAVDGVMVAGRWVIENGRHAEEDRIAANYRRVLKKLMAL